jgi:hypothetical protein
MILGHDKVSKWFELLGMIIWFTFVEGNHIEKNYRINSIMIILKFSYLNLNILGNDATGYRFSICSIYKRNQLNMTYRI